MDKDLEKDPGTGSDEGADPESAPQASGDDGKAKKRSVWKKVAAIAIIVLIILLLFVRCSGKREAVGNGSVTFGVIDVDDPGGDGARDLQALANAVLEENMFRVFITTRMEVDREGAFAPMIQNTSVNRHPCWVEILDDDGSTIYESDVIEPGYKIERDVLSEPLTRGKHDCKAYFHVMEAADKDGKEIDIVGVDVTMVQRK